MARLERTLESVENHLFRIDAALGWLLEQQGCVLVYRNGVWEVEPSALQGNGFVEPEGPEGGQDTDEGEKVPGEVTETVPAENVVALEDAPRASSRSKTKK